MDAAHAAHKEINNLKRIYDRTVKELVIEFVQQYYSQKENINKNFQKNEIVVWFEKYYPKIKLGTISAHLLKLSVNAPSRIYYSIHNDGTDDLLFQVSSTTFRKYDSKNDSEPIYKDNRQ
jgi:hypothetical protein